MRIIALNFALLTLVCGCITADVTESPKPGLPDQIPDEQVDDNDDTDNTNTDESDRPLNNIEGVVTPDGVSFPHGELFPHFHNPLTVGHGALNGWAEETLLLGFPALEGDISEIWDYMISGYSDDRVCNTIVEYEIEELYMNDGPQRCPAADATFEGSRWKIDPIDVGTMRVVVVGRKVSEEKTQVLGDEGDWCADRVYPERFSYQLTINVVQPTSVEFELPEQCGSVARIAERTPLSFSSTIFAGETDVTDAANYPGMPAFDVSAIGADEITVGRGVHLVPNSPKTIELESEFGDMLTIESVSSEQNEGFVLVPYAGSKAAEPFGSDGRPGQKVYFSVTESEFPDTHCTDFVMPTLISDSPEVCGVTDDYYGGALDFRVPGLVTMLAPGTCEIRGVTDGYEASIQFDIAN